MMSDSNTLDVPVPARLTFQQLDFVLLYSDEDRQQAKEYVNLWRSWGLKGCLYNDISFLPWSCQEKFQLVRYLTNRASLKIILVSEHLKKNRSVAFLKDTLIDQSIEKRDHSFVPIFLCEKTVLYYDDDDDDDDDNDAFFGLRSYYGIYPDDANDADEFKKHFEKEDVKAKKRAREKKQEDNLELWIKSETDKRIIKGSLAREHALEHKKQIKDLLKAGRRDIPFIVQAEIEKLLENPHDPEPHYERTSEASDKEDITIRRLLEEFAKRNDRGFEEFAKRYDRDYKELLEEFKELKLNQDLAAKEDGSAGKTYYTIHIHQPKGDLHVGTRNVTENPPMHAEHENKLFSEDGEVTSAEIVRPSQDQQATHPQPTFNFGKFAIDDNYEADDFKKSTSSTNVDVNKHKSDDSKGLDKIINSNKSDDSKNLDKISEFGSSFEVSVSTVLTTEKKGLPLLPAWGPLIPSSSRIENQSTESINEFPSIGHTLTSGDFTIQDGNEIEVQAEYQSVSTYKIGDSDTNLKTDFIRDSESKNNSTEAMRPSQEHSGTETGEQTRIKTVKPQTDLDKPSVSLQHSSPETQLLVPKELSNIHIEGEREDSIQQSIDVSRQQRIDENRTEENPSVNLHPCISQNSEEQSASEDTRPSDLLTSVQSVVTEDPKTHGTWV